MVCDCDPRTQEAKEGGSPQVQGSSGLHSEFQVSLRCSVILCLKEKQKLGAADLNSASPVTFILGKKEEISKLSFYSGVGSLGF